MGVFLAELFVLEGQAGVAGLLNFEQLGEGWGGGCGLWEGGGGCGGGVGEGLRNGLGGSGVNR